MIDDDALHAGSSWSPPPSRRCCCPKCWTHSLKIKLLLRHRPDSTHSGTRFVAQAHRWALAPPLDGSPVVDSSAAWSFLRLSELGAESVLVDSLSAVAEAAGRMEVEQMGERLTKLPKACFCLLESHQRVWHIHLALSRSRCDPRRSAGARLRPGAAACDQQGRWPCTGHAASGAAPHSFISRPFMDRETDCFHGSQPEARSLIVRPRLGRLSSRRPPPRTSSTCCCCSGTSRRQQRQPTCWGTGEPCRQSGNQAIIKGRPSLHSALPVFGMHPLHHGPQSYEGFPLK